jgi:hypothetical protein
MYSENTINRAKLCTFTEYAELWKCGVNVFAEYTEWNLTYAENTISETAHKHLTVRIPRIRIQIYRQIRQINIKYLAG